MQEKPVIIAHRGASAYAPENTISAFKKALELGADGIELDVQLTADGYPVVLHDESINRTSSGSGMVKDLSLSYLKTLDFGSWFGNEFENERIPLLEEVLAFLSGSKCILNVELKNGVVPYSGLENKVVGLISEYNFTERTIISSFNHYSLVEVKKLSSGLKTGILYSCSLVNPWEYAQKIAANALHPYHKSIPINIIQKCRNNGIAVNPYTIDDPDTIKNLALAGVSGIITNVPDIAAHSIL